MKKPFSHFFLFGGGDDGDGDGGDDDFFFQPHPTPHPITPRDSITRSGTPYADVKRDDEMI